MSRTSTSTSISTRTERNIAQWWIHAFFILFSLGFILPLCMIVAISISNERDILNEGYRLIPRSLDFTAYKMVFESPQQIIDSYQTTTFAALTGTLLGTLVMAMLGFALSRSQYKLRKPLAFFVFFTMLFGGGLVPSYILINQYLKLGDTVWVYIFPTLATGFHIIIFRTFFMGLPTALFESAKIDGARELTIFFRIVLPLSKPVLATIALIGLLSRWNDWYTALIYIRTPSLYSLQYNLQKILLEVQWLQDNYDKLPPGLMVEELSAMPSETLKMAVVIIVAGPMLCIFPFFQKYFTKGLTVGAIKG